MDFVGKRKFWYLLSIVIIIFGVISLGVRGLNLGVDFNGGNMLKISFEKKTSAGEVRKVFEELGIKDHSVSTLEGNQFLVRTSTLSEEKNKQLVSVMEEKVGKFNILLNEKVSPVIGRELTRNALYALVIAAVLMVGYISYRFQFLFGIAAITALLHDVLVMVAFFSFLQLQVDNTFIAAILTLIGYSINNTIVIFDRIRENLGARKKGNLLDLVNSSISQTLRRSINTSLTVVLVLLALIFFGGETTQNLAIALLIGTVFGTYSSIFIAGPLWVDLRSLTAKKGRGNHKSKGAHAH